VPDLVPVDIQGVVVEPRVADQAAPLVPAVRDVVAIVFVEIFAKVSCNCNCNNDDVVWLILHICCC
jgi:hypothetical protein